MMRIFLFSIVLVLIGCHRSTDKNSYIFEGVGVDGGGDSVYCESGSGNFSGHYSLDYLMSYDDQTGSSDDLRGGSWDEIKPKLIQLIRNKLPGAEANFREYLDSFLTNQPDRRRQWIASDAGVDDIKDEDLIRLLPQNCLKRNHNGDLVPNLTQTVWRREVSEGINQRVFYYYNRDNFFTLRDTHPLQFSYIVVHEWLWDYTLSPWINRTLNRLIHTQSAHEMTPEAFRNYMKSLGIDVSNDGTPIPRDLAESPMRRVFAQNPVCNVDQYYIAEFKNSEALHHITLGAGETADLALTVPDHAVDRVDWRGACGFALVINPSKTMPTAELQITVGRGNVRVDPMSMRIGSSNSLSGSFVYAQCTDGRCRTRNGDGELPSIMSPNVTNGARWHLEVTNRSSQQISFQNPYVLYVGQR